MMHLSRLSLLPLLLSLNLFSCEQKPIHYLTPPKLGKEYILREVLCHRPMRGDQLRAEREEVGEQARIHGYGTRSGGWCMAPALGEHLVSLLKPSDKNKSTAVVGGGVIGLFSAYALVKNGYNPTVIAESFNDLTSHKAGGLFAHMRNPLVNELCGKSCKTYMQIARGQHPDFSKGVRLLPAYFASRKDSDLEAYIKDGINPGRDVIVDFKNGTRRNLVVYDNCPFIDTYVMMAALQTFLKEKNVPFVQQHVANLADLPQSLVFNCSALGARALVGDQRVYPAQGHLLMLKNQNPNDLQYLLEVPFEEGKTDDGLSVDRLVYCFPKKLPGANAGEIGVIGGTFINKGDETNPREHEFERVRVNACNYFGIDSKL